MSLSGSTPRLPLETPRGNWDSPEAAPRPEEEGPSALPWLLPAWRSGLERGDVRDRYHVIPQELGRGCYGVVRRCRERATGRALALKTVPKARVRQPEALRREARVLAALDHPNIVRLEAAYEDERYVHLVQELCAGGELFDQIVARARRSGSYAAFGEAEAARLFAQILDAVAYLHARGVVHRDLKPENFLFLADAPGAPLKLVDFGLCALVGGEGGGEGGGSAAAARRLTTKVGTPYYIAPEVLEGVGYTEACDVWSCGVLLHTLLVGYAPFTGPTDAAIFERVCGAPLRLRADCGWGRISPAAQALVRALLDRDVARRPTARQALRHPWLAAAVEELHRRQDDPPAAAAAADALAAAAADGVKAGDGAATPPAAGAGAVPGGPSPAAAAAEAAEAVAPQQRLPSVARRYAYQGREEGGPGAVAGGGGSNARLDHCKAARALARRLTGAELVGLGAALAARDARGVGVLAAAEVRAALQQGAQGAALAAAAGLPEEWGRLEGKAPVAYAAVLKAAEDLQKRARLDARGQAERAAADRRWRPGGAAGAEEEASATAAAAAVASSAPVRRGGRPLYSVSASAESDMTTGQVVAADEARPVGAVASAAAALGRLPALAGEVRRAVPGGNYTQVALC